MRGELEGQGVSAETDTGFGVKLAIGKDWLISRKVALGAAVQGSWGSMKDQGTNPPTWTALGFGATFNVCWVPKGFID
jgi:hypothetical protein